jgi:hypothetical protein
MDSYREHPSDFDPPYSAEVAASDDVTNADAVAAAIGTDERRMHVRAYNHWVSLLDGRDFPSIEDLEPADVQDFESNSVLLDFTCGRDNPAIPYIGAEIRDECGLDDDTRSIDDVPSRSLLSRLTDHYMQIIANRAPIGFEAEFANQREQTICYRGILMPFSSDGETIDFIYGVINWKTVGAHAPSEAPQDAVDEAEPLSIEEAVASAQPEPETERGPQPEPEPETIGEKQWLVSDLVPDAIAEELAQPPAVPVHFAWEDGPLNDGDADADALPELLIDEDAALADRLWAARETAETVKAGEGRTRGALYRALSLAYDFALAAQDDPADYAELLEESGVKVQARAPMTAVVKLVFGIDYDKARLTEFAAALSFAGRQQVARGGFQDLIEKRSGGLKALVAAERQARRPEARPDTKGEAARAKLRGAAPIALAEISADAEFAVIVTRRGGDGRHEAVAVLADEGLIERVIRRAA